MSNSQAEQAPRKAALPGLLRLIAMFAVLVMAGLGVLVVFDVIEINDMREALIKLGLVTAIAIAVTSSIWLLSKR